MKIPISVLYNAFPLIIFFTEIFLSFKIIYIRKNKEKIDVFQELMVILFLIYIVGLFYIVTMPKYSYEIINLRPFKEILRYSINSKLFVKNVIGNLLLFIPYGFFISFYFKLNRLYLIMLFASLLSITIELIQIHVGRVFDIDDIILNTVSGCLGHFLYRVCNVKK